MEHNPQLASLPAVVAAEAAAASANDLPALAAALAAYDAHPLARASRPVPGRFGDQAPADRPLLLLGKSPGATEVETGRPFTGPMAQMLRRAAVMAGHDVEQAYQTHATPWRPRPGKPPNATQLAFSRPFLVREVELVQPRCIVALGASVMDSLFGDHHDLEERTGDVVEWSGIPCVVSRNQGHYAHFPDDMPAFVDTLRRAWAI